MAVGKFWVVILLLFSFVSAAYAQVDAPQLDANYALPGPVTLPVTLTLNSAANGTISATSNSNAASVPSVSFSDSDFSLVGGEYVLTKNLQINGLDVGQFTLTVVAQSDSTTLGTISRSSSFYYATYPKILQSTVNSTTTLLTLSFTTDMASSCKFDYSPTTYSSAAFTIYNTSASGTKHTYQLANPPEKQYDFYVVCKGDVSGLEMPDAEHISYLPDRTIPVVLSHDPTRVDDKLELAIQTNEPTMCRFGTSDAAYSSLPSYFDYSYQTSHTVSIPIQSTTISIYIRCSDASQNVMTQSYLAKYDVEQPPTATIDVLSYKKGDYLQDGVHNLEVRVSKKLAKTPTLSLVTIDDSTKEEISIPLVQQSDLEYEGSFILNPESFNGVAYFTFTGLDLFGQTGTEIEGESTVQIITYKPSPVTSLRVEPHNSTIRITFDYTPDVYFNNFIIRKYLATDLTSHIVSISTDELEYVDTHVIDGKSYVYEVVTVNKADKNSVPVRSDVVYAAVTDSKPPKDIPVSESSSSSYTMPVYLQQNLAVAQNRISDLKTKLLSTGTSPLFSELGLDESNRKIIDELTSALTKAQTTIYLKDSQVADQIAYLLELERSANQRYVVVAKILETRTLDQTLTDEFISKQLDEYLILKRWEGDEALFNNLLKTVTEDNAKAKRNGTTTQVQIVRANDANEVYTLVTKSVELPEAHQTFEYIPSDIGEVFYKDPSYKKSGNFLISNGDVTYYFKEALPAQLVQSTKTIIFPSDPFEKATISAGNFFKQISGSALYYTLGILSILALAFYYFDGVQLVKTFASKNGAKQKTQPVTQKTESSLAYLLEDKPLTPKHLKAEPKAVQHHVVKEEKVEEATHTSTTSHATHTPIRVRKIGPHEYFITCDGKKLATFEDAAFAIANMSDHAFAHHVNDHKNDFAMWVRDVFGLSERAWELKDVKDKQHLSELFFELSKEVEHE
ncbi:MAG TPA: fibronectin type III domain-containing protein [Acidobacteriota bacterium]|nr:fibronectin type III domain-containing protein [Acidobacteriota bacterium]